MAFAEVPELRSQGGVLEVDFEVADRRTTIGGRTVEGKSYADGVQGPTLRLAPGERLRLHLRNRLDQATNLHFHGMHVSPLPPGDDVLMHVPAGEEFTYEIDVPADHARGTYWYHSHQHGTSEAQVFAGLSGVLIVEGLEDLLPAALRDVPQRVLALKDVQVVGRRRGGPGHRLQRADHPAGQRPGAAPAHGGAGRDPAVAPGQHRRRHLLRRRSSPASRSRWWARTATPCGRCGRPTTWSCPRASATTCSSRPGAGSATLSTLAYDQGGDQYPAVPLATLDTTGTPVPAAAAARLTHRRPRAGHRRRRPVPGHRVRRVRQGRLADRRQGVRHEPRRPAA